MKVIIDKDGVGTHSVNDKAKISHEIAQKTTLSKRSDGTISNKNVRTVGGNKKDANVDNSPRGSPSTASQKAKHFSQSSPQSSPTKQYNAPQNKAVGTGGKANMTLQNQSVRVVGTENKAIRNKIDAKNELTKKKERVISGKKTAKLKKAKLKKLKKQQIKISREQAQLIGLAMGGYTAAAAAKKPNITKAVGGVKKAVHIAGKPVETLKRGFYSRADKSDDNGVKAAKLGLQISDYATSGVKTAVNTGVKTVKKGAKITKRVYRKIHKTTSAELRRTIRKRVLRQKIGAQAKYLAKRTASNAAKATAKATQKAAAKAAQVAARAAQAAAKAVASAVTKIVSIIAETMPYSLIIIGAIALIIVFALMFTSLISGAGGSVAGGGAWLVNDSNSQTPEEIYEGYKEFIEQARDVMQKQAKNALKSQVTGFCESDTTDPRKIIQYIDKNNNLTIYPAAGADSSINALIEQFGAEDYADYMSLLFVLMTREKQQADGVTDAEIYDFDFTKADFEEFMKTVNENSCRWGDTFIFKTAVETSPHACPGENCKIKTIPGCRCASYTDENGRIHYYCGGHPYCPVNHTKLTVRLYTIKDYYQMDYPEIYNFTENERIRYEASRAIIQGLLEYWEG